MKLSLFDARPCDLGEGPLWHPLRQELFWFDITGRRMLSRQGETAREWALDEMHSAAGWVDENRLLLASETGLWLFDLTRAAREKLCDLEAENPLTRSNDGRADPQGGFWIGTMGKQAEAGAGAIWRWYRGELRRLFGEITISNAICFTPDGREARFTDTVTRKVMAVALDAEGWPAAAPRLWLDLAAEELNPDGAVIDAAGRFWVAQWGAGRVAAYGPDGSFLGGAALDAPHASCPAFGGPDLTTLFCTSALQGMTPAARTAYPAAGGVFAGTAMGPGQREHQVRLPE